MVVRIYEAPPGYVLGPSEVDGFAVSPEICPEKRLPDSVRYVKLGRGGEWWPVSQARGELHAGWREIDADILRRGSSEEIAQVIRSMKGDGGNVTQDLNALTTLIDRPSRHFWVTFEGGFMWWCLVRDGIVPNPNGVSAKEGHFWLQCERPWSDRSLGGRLLAMGDLPGSVTATAGFRATVCEPGASERILRIIRDQSSDALIMSSKARFAYEQTTMTLVAELDPKDFEQLVDLLLTRSGWARISTLGGPVEGYDIEIESAATGEVAFVQVKSRAGTAEFVDYVRRFQARRERYSKMIFAVHRETSTLRSEPPDIHIWNIETIAKLAVRYDLVGWLERRVG